MNIYWGVAPVMETHTETTMYLNDGTHFTEGDPGDTGALYDKNDVTGYSQNTVTQPTGQYFSYLSTTPLPDNYGKTTVTPVDFEKQADLQFLKAAGVVLATVLTDTEEAAPEMLAEDVTTPIGELRAAGLKDAHHAIQDAAVRDLSGYDTELAPGVQLEGPSTAFGTPHYLATQAQRAAGGGTYAAERDVAANSLRAAGYSEPQIQQALGEADEYFQNIGVKPSTLTRIPGNRKP